MATKKNAQSLELMHAWSKAQKAAYNKDYYRKNKDYWVRYYSAKDKWELGDNRDVRNQAVDRFRNAEDRYNRAEELRKERFKDADRLTEEANMAERKGLPGVAKALRDKANVNKEDAVSYYRDREWINKKQLNPLRGDVKRLENAEDEHRYGSPSRRPTASAPTGSAGNPRLKKAKRVVENAVKSYKSAYEAGLSSLASAGKNFINKIAHTETTITVVPGVPGAKPKTTKTVGKIFD